MALHDFSPTDHTRPPEVRATAVVALAACAAVLVASIVAGGLLRVAQRSTGAAATPIVESASFQGLAVRQGVTVLAPIQFAIVAPTDRPVSWVAIDRGHVYQRGQVHGKPGAEVVVTLPTWTMKPGTWLTIAISGMQTPLKAWIR